MFTIYKKNGIIVSVTKMKKKEIELKIIQLIDKIRPFLINDGGNINFDNKMMIVDLDVVRVENVPKAYDD